MKATCLQVPDVPPLVMPPRSRLFNLKPIGLGTPLAECLASYLHRLAAAHGLPTWVLVLRELVPQFERKSITGPNGYCDLFGQVGMTINGDNNTAREAVAILQSLTGQATLRSLTFSRLGTLVAEQRILRRTQAWCPACLNQWRTDQQPVYQPLVWLLSQLQSCPVHGGPLADRCPSCGKAHTALTRYRWTGHCPRCATWLGTPPLLTDSPPEKLLLSDWDKHAASALGRLVVVMQSLPAASPQATFAANINSLVQNHFAGNFSALARCLRVHGFTVSCWASGKQRPSLASLLALSYCFGGELLDWIAGNMDVAKLPTARTIAPLVATRVRRPLQHQPRADMRARLAQAALSTEFPPPSFRVVCQRLGLDPTPAQRLHPDLAAEIKGRHAQYLSEAKRAREQSLRIAVESAVQQLLATGLTLSYKHLRLFLPPEISTRDKFVRTVFRQLQSELASRVVTLI